MSPRDSATVVSCGPFRRTGRFGLRATSWHGRLPNSFQARRGVVEDSRPARSGRSAAAVSVGTRSLEPPVSKPRQQRGHDAPVFLAYARVRQYSQPWSATVPRYRDRSLQVLDLIPRFESQSSAEHCRNAVAVIQRLRDDRRGYCQRNTEEDNKWMEVCNDLLSFLYETRLRREIRNQDLATAFREYLDTFEHSTKRIDQILHSKYAQRAGAPNPNAIHDWLDFAYRLSTYAILSTWIDDKTENRTATIQIDLASGKVKEEWSHDPMTVPRKYRPAAKEL